MNTHFEPRFLTITTESNALDYLEKAFFYIRLVDVDHTAWKWVILALHGAIYGFAICACKGTNPDNVIKRSKNGEERLVSFGEALEMCQDEARMKMTVNSRHLKLSDNQKTAIRQLKDNFRNVFEHFAPMSFHVSLHELPTMCLECLPVIEFLALKTGNYMNLAANEGERINFIVRQSQHALKSSLLYKEIVLGADHEG